MLLSFLAGAHEARSVIKAKRYEIEALAERRLRSIVEEAYRRVPFYSRIFRDRNLSPANIRNVEDLSKLPILTRKDIIENHGQMLNQDFQLDDCIRKRTSGSTGEPVSCLFDPEGWYRFEGIALRGQLQGGLRVSDRVAVVGSPNSILTPNKIYRILSRFRRVKYASVFDNTGATFSALRAFEPGVLKTHPSFLKAAMETNERLDCRLVFTMSELLDQDLRKRVAGDFGARIIDLYGAVEFTSIAWECRESSLYHLDSDAVVVEALKLDSDLPASPGERARIVVTGLLNCAMPLIRYDLGDLGIFTDEECSCGIKLPLLKAIEGRRVDCIRLPSGRLVSPYMLTDVVREIDGIRQYQVVQEQRDKILVRIVPRLKSGFNEKAIEYLVKTVKNLLVEDVSVEVEVVESIHIERLGKYKYVLSKVS